MTGKPVSFAGYRVDPAARELWKGASLVDLPPHVFDCLCHLIEHRDRAVGRDELVAAVWGKTEVSDTLIGQTILRIRREFGDDGKDQRILRTIPRFGYRWVAEIDEQLDHPSATPSQGAVGGTAPAVVDSSAIPATVETLQPGDLASAPPRRHPRALVLAGWLALPAVFLGLALLLIPATPPPELGVQNNVTGALTAAVLLANLDQGANSEWSWLRFGVMDAVSGRLRSSGLPAIPSESVIALQGSSGNQDPEQLRNAAKVKLLVRPSVSASGGSWQVRLEADDGAQLHVSVDAQAQDAMLAARIAADKLLQVLGHDVPSGQVEADPMDLLIQRVDAAVLADDPETAKSLIRQAPASQRDSAEVGLRLAKIDFRSGHSEEALLRLQSLLERTPAETQPELRAGILNGLGALAVRADQLANATDYFSEAVSLLLDRHDPAQLGEAYLGRAAAATEQNRFDEATADYALARVALRQANDTLALLRVDANEGVLDLGRGLPAQALDQLITASQGFEQWGALIEAIFTRINEIEARLVLLQIQEALDAASAAERLAQRIDSPTARISLALTKSKALAAAGRWSEARTLLSTLREESPPPGIATEISEQLAAMLLDEGKPLEALHQLESQPQALNLTRQTSERVEAQWIRLSALIQLGDRAGATPAFAEFESLAGSTVDPRARMLAQLGRAGMAWRFGASSAHADFSKAVQMAEASGVPADIVTAAASYADVLLAEGNLEQASIEVGRLSRWSDKDYRCAVLEARLYAALGLDEARQAALTRARSLAGERILPEDAVSKPVSTREASSH